MKEKRFKKTYSQGAIDGVWEEEKAWKRFFYKHLKPCSWIKDYWK